ncbi:uncharacterized protein [Macrobrachium rosenbergii]|uniref:uncharacterized protein isoform X3 n=1 Tax=Macrobrachium rosenbergii TaxID=79674 RepID=UPI0034D77B4A
MIELKVTRDSPSEEPSFLPSSVLSSIKILGMLVCLMVLHVTLPIAALQVVFETHQMQTGQRSSESEVAVLDHQEGSWFCGERVRTAVHFVFFTSYWRV